MQLGRNSEVAVLQKVPSKWPRLKCDPTSNTNAFVFEVGLHFSRGHLLIRSLIAVVLIACQSHKLAALPTWDLEKGGRFKSLTMGAQEWTAIKISPTALRRYQAFKIFHNWRYEMWNASSEIWWAHFTLHTVKLNWRKVLPNEWIPRCHQLLLFYQMPLFDVRANNTTMCQLIILLPHKLLQYNWPQLFINWTLIIMHEHYIHYSYVYNYMMHVIAALGRISIEMYNKKWHERWTMLCMYVQ